MIQIAIQGYSGSFHEEAVAQYFEGSSYQVVPCDTFDVLCHKLHHGEVDFAAMAIENSIAGSILQNYRLLREYKLWILGEIYLEIKHQLCVNKGSHLSQIKRVYSHPMAINQCLPFLRKMEGVKLIESEDTALSAIQLATAPNPKHACIASVRAAALNGLEIIAYDIQSHQNNYTRFFILSNTETAPDPAANKASVYLSIPDQKGRLLKVLQLIHHHELNMSKLQSFPILGRFREYFFHIDLEFEDITQYLALRQDLVNQQFTIEAMGIYNRADQHIITES